MNRRTAEAAQAVIILGNVLLRGAIRVAALYVILHFVVKYW